MTTPEDPNQPHEPPPGYGPPPPGYRPPPPGYGPPPPGYGPPPNPSSSTPMVLGIIGIVMAVCCWPIGLTLGILSYTQAKKQPAANTTLGVVAIALSILSAVVNVAALASGHGFVYYRNS